MKNKITKKKTCFYAFYERYNMFFVFNGGCIFTIPKGLQMKPPKITRGYNM